MGVLVGSDGGEDWVVSVDRADRLGGVVSSVVESPIVEARNDGMR